MDERRPSKKKKGGRDSRPAHRRKGKLWTRYDQCRNHGECQWRTHDTNRVAGRRIELSRRDARRDEGTRAAEVVRHVRLIQNAAEVAGSSTIAEAHADPPCVGRRVHEARDLEALRLQREVEPLLLTGG